MTIRSENSRIGGLLLGAATGLATIFAVVPQMAVAQGWQAEISGNSVKKPTSGPRPANMDAPKPGQTRPLPVSVDDAPLLITPPARPVPLSRKRALARNENGLDKNKAGAAASTQEQPASGFISRLEPAKAVVITPLREPDNEPPVIISSARKPRPAVAPQADIPTPVVANQPAEAAASGAPMLATTAPAKEEPAKSEPTVEPAQAEAPKSAPATATGDKNHTVAEKTPARDEPAEMLKIPTAPLPPAEPKKPEIAAPVPVTVEEPVVVIAPALRKPETDAALTANIAGNETANTKAKGGGEPKKAADARTAKGKSRKSDQKPDPAKAKPPVEEEAPVIISSKPDKDGKPRGKGQEPASAASTTPDANPPKPVAPVAIIGPASLEPVVPEAFANAVSPVMSPSAAITAAGPQQPKNEAALPIVPPAAQAQAEDEDEPNDPFVNVQLQERVIEGETLTTQVVPTNTPPDITGQATPVDRNPAAQYCSNIADAAIDARIEWQRQNLAEVEKQIQSRTEELEAKTAEYQRWLARRDAFSEKAKKVVVDIYTKMKPDAAALQLQALEEETAAAVLVKLDARSASAVMNEMEPEKAARLTAIISGAARGPQLRNRPSPRETGNRS
jgi:flagellar motility protein MotE (MotC chaperone)